ncbi:hypothetical protein D3C87_1944480 [compost metagenome]
MVVALLLAGVDAGDLDLAGDDGLGHVVGVELEGAGVGLELAAHGGDHHVLHREADVGVRVVDLPGHRLLPFRIQFHLRGTI